MAEIITKDCKEYHIWDKVNGVWNRLFFKTNAKSVEADDGKELQTKVGAINGISSSSTATDENIAASIGYVNQELTELNTNLSKISENCDVVLLAEVTALQDYQSYQLPDGIKISDFRFIYETLYAPDDSTQILATDIIPVPIFKSGIALVTQYNSETW